MYDTQDSETFFGSVPSSPALPNAATLADSTEIRDFDLGISRGQDDNRVVVSRATVPAALRRLNSSGVGGTPASSSSRPRHYSTGQIPGAMDGKRESSPLLFNDAAHHSFVQLYTLGGTECNPKEWVEVSRWIKYEQDLEEGSSRLGKPHIAPMAQLFLNILQGILRKCIFLDLGEEEEGEKERDLSGIGSLVSATLVSKGILDKGEGERVRKDFSLHFRSTGIRAGSIVSLGGRRRIQRQRTLSTGERRHSLHRRIVHEESQEVEDERARLEDEVQVEVCATPPKSGGGRRGTLSSIKQYFSSEDVEDEGGGFLLLESGTIILICGGCKSLRGTTMVLVRLTQPLLQIGIPISSIFILFPPASGSPEESTEIGKSLGTLMASGKFRECVKGAKEGRELVAGLQDLLDESIILPPGIWKNLHELLPIHVLEEKAELIRRKREQEGVGADGIKRIGTASTVGADGVGFGTIVLEPGEEFGAGKREDGGGGSGSGTAIPGPFIRTKKLYGGLINDVRRRYPFYKRDILDGLNSQTLAACIFLYFAAIAHNVTFGGLLGEKTNGYVGVPETLIAASVAGTIFALFAGQPLNCIAPTGPLLVFDELLYKFMSRHGLEFLPTRVWIGGWVVVIALIVIAFEGSVLVRNFSRFTMETFSALISVIFCYESIESLLHVYHTHPLRRGGRNWATDNNSTDPPDLKMENEPNTALLSTFLMFGTFILAFRLKHLRNSHFFPEKVRNVLGDFAVPIGIIVMVSVDSWAGDVYTTKIKVPAGLEPTRKRPWLVNPFGVEQPFNYWTPLITFLPGALVFLLVFMTVEICEKIMLANAALKRGCGLHLDALILSFTNLFCALFGFPWVSVATLKALAHVSALTVYSKNNPPGVAPTPIYVRENRLSALVMSVLIGLSIFMAPILKLIGMPVLFGVFLYMGITSFLPTQLNDRLQLLFIPTASHPQTIYVRRVPTWKIHLFTAIQVGSLAALWAVKSVKEIALFFPIILILLVPIRKSLKYIFTESELDALDGANPQETKGDE